MGTIAAQRQYIEGYCNVNNDTFTFTLYLQNTGYVNRTVHTDNSGYWKYVLTQEERTDIRSLDGFATSISQAESNKLVSIVFSNNFPFDNLNIKHLRCIFGSYASTYFGCRNLTAISGWKLNPQNTAAAYQSLLSYCISLYNIDISTLKGNKNSDYSNIFRRVPASQIIGLRQFMEDSEPSAFGSAFDYCTNLTNASIPTLKNNVNTSGSFRQCTALTTIDYCGDISNNIDISNSPLYLSSAILILQHLLDVTSYGGKTLAFSATTSALIQADTTAMNLVAQAQANGWTITFN